MKGKADDVDDEEMERAERNKQRLALFLMRRSLAVV